MAHISLTLEGVSFTLADGRVLFQDLNQVFDQRRTGLVGRNGAGKSTLRTHLAQMGLEAQLAAAPVAGLSGGERLTVALACALYAHPPAQLLLLDEPSNHLDLVSLEALETMLGHYQGALLVVSHDAAFMASLRLTHVLEAGAGGWCLRQLANQV